MCNFVVAQKVNARQIDMQRSLDSPPSRLVHTSPVFKRFANEPVSRDRGDRHIPVLNLNRVQRNIDYVSVRISLRHLNPITDSDHVIRHYLKARHQRQNRIPKDQHEKGGERAQTRQEHHR